MRTKFTENTGFFIRLYARGLLAYQYDIDERNRENFKRDIKELIYFGKKVELCLCDRAESKMKWDELMKFAISLDRGPKVKKIKTKEIHK